MPVNHPWHEVTHFYIGPWKGRLKWVKTPSPGEERNQFTLTVPLPCAKNFTWVSCVISHQSCGRMKKIILHFAD